MGKSILKVFVIGSLLGYFLYLSVNLTSTLERYILLSIALFSIGIYGLIASRNVIEC